MPGGGTVLAPDGREIAVVHFDHINAWSDAGLILAAPELLEALKAMLEQADEDLASINDYRANGGWSDLSESDATKNARAAIAKAEGRG